MRVGWLQDPAPYIGGAELTAHEQREAAPAGVEIVDCPPGAVSEDCDAYVVHNCVSYGPDDLEPLGPTVKYVNDLWPHGNPVVRSWLLENALCVFTSPYHLRRFPWRAADTIVIPPALDTDAFRPSRQTARHPEKRSGAVAVGSWQNPGKGQQLLREWSEAHEPVDVFGSGPFVPHGPRLLPRGEVSREDLPQLLWGYETFVHLPTEPEPFGRAVIEAWLAGCHVVTNRNVGARHYFDHAEELDSAAEDFWGVVV